MINWFRYVVLGVRLAFIPIVIPFLSISAFVYIVNRKFIKKIQNR